MKCLTVERWWSVPYIRNLRLKKNTHTHKLQRHSFPMTYEVWPNCQWPVTTEKTNTTFLTHVVRTNPICIASNKLQFYNIYMTNFRYFTIAEHLLTLLYDSWGSHANEYEEQCFLGCDTTYWVEMFLCFGGTYCLYLQSRRRMQQVPPKCQYVLPDCMVPQRRRRYCSIFAMFGHLYRIMIVIFTTDILWHFTINHY
jgi:hypothetical protein